jgi:uncharacterized protein YegP (UPF0339 family)
VTRFVRALVVAAGLVGFTIAGSATTAPAVAQQKKETKKSTKAAAGTIEINEGKDGKYRFLIRDGEGKLLAMSGPTGFEKRDEAVKAIETLKDVLPGAKMVTGKKTK